VIGLEQFVMHFARGIELADARRPVALNQRTKIAFQPGLGPHTEARAVELVMCELTRVDPDQFGAHTRGVPYVTLPRQRCDLCLGTGPAWDWSIEIKLLRFLGDNGQSNDNMLMHILSPYPEHRSALSDCGKLVASGLKGRKAIVIYGFDSDAWPLAPAVDAFETLARARHGLRARCEAAFSGLVHPIHRSGAVYAWELVEERSA
jgi:hypothetical protein